MGIGAVGLDPVRFAKTILTSAYASAPFVPHRDKILAILRMQGKRAIVDHIAGGHVSLDAAIHDDSYYLTNLDLWMIFHAARIPVVLFYSTREKTMLPDAGWIFLNGGDLASAHAPLHFIRSPTVIEINTPARYTLIKRTFHADDLGEFGTEMDRALGGDPSLARNVQSLETFMESAVIAPAAAVRAQKRASHGAATLHEGLAPAHA
jgi:hypothetical protein